jgi:hypothetical protein
MKERGLRPPGIPSEEHSGHLHRRRSVIYTMDGEGQKLSCIRIGNEPAA